MNVLWGWLARRLIPFLQPLLLELLEQEKFRSSEYHQGAAAEPVADISAYVVREQLAEEIAPLVHECLIKQIRVWGDRDRLHLAPSAGLVNTLFNTVSGHITIGDYSFTGHNVSILTGTHDVRQQLWQRMSAYPPEGRDIVIGQGVWIGSNATVLGPCTIGDHAVVAAGAVLLPGTAVPSGAIVAGVPAKVVKMIEFAPDDA